MISDLKHAKIFCRTGILRNVCPRPIIDLILELELILFCSRRKVKKTGKEQTKAKRKKVDMENDMENDVRRKLKLERKSLNNRTSEL